MITKLKNMRILFTALILGLSIFVYAAEPLPVGDYCRGCGDTQMCDDGGSYYGPGWEHCGYTMIDGVPSDCHVWGIYGLCNGGA